MIIVNLWNYLPARLPWFGLDIGGSLVKLVYFEPCSSQLNCKGQEKVGLEAIQDFIKSNIHYGEEGRRDENLAMEHVMLGNREGHLHFIRFPTDAVDTFLLVAKEMNASVLNNKVCATGGGAFKFEKDFREVWYQSLQLLCSFQLIMSRILCAYNRYPYKESGLPKWLGIDL